MVGSDLDSGGHAAIGIDGELDRRQAAARPQTPGFDQQSVGDKILDDVGDGLRAEMRMPRDLHAPDRSELAHDVQHHPAVVGPVPLRVAPDRRPALLPWIFLAFHPLHGATMT